MRTVYNVTTLNSTSAGTTPIPSGSSIVTFDGTNLRTMDATGSFYTLPGAGADPAAAYLVVSATGSLSAERTVSAGPGIAFTDGGANGSFGISASLLAGTNVTINQVGNSYAISSSATGGSGADPNATFVLASSTGSLTNGKVLTAGPGIIVSSSANTINVSASLLAGTNVTIDLVGGAYAISASGGSGGGDTAATYLVVSNTASLSAERALAAGPGIAFTDGGANGSFAISASLLAGPNITINQVGNAYAITGSASGGGSGADPNAAYVVASATGSLANAQVLTAGPGIAVTSSAGLISVSASLLAGTNVTINQVGNSYAISSSAEGGGSGADPAASYLVLSTTASLTNERTLTAGPGINFTDGGANGNLTVSASLLAGPNVTINRVSNSFAISSSLGSFTIPDFFSPLDWYTANSSSASPPLAGFDAGDYTVGTQFSVTRARTLTGVRFRTFFPGRFTIGLWDPNGTMIRSQSFNTNTTGVLSVTFTSSYSVPTYRIVAVSVYHTGAYFNFALLPAPTNPTYGYLVASPSVVFEPGYGRFAGPDTYPTSNSGYFYLVEPIFASVTQAIT